MKRPNVLKPPGEPANGKFPRWACPAPCLLWCWEGLALLLCVALFVALRARWLGHLLSWDEAMNLCTVRAFGSDGRDVFSNWFWRHPPLYCLLMRLLQPLRAGFAERVELMNLALGSLNMGLLYTLNRKAFGRHAALWTAFFLAVMPAGIFFDVWIKRDHLVVTFALGSFLFLLSGRSLYAGLCLGLALLSKETAVFFWGAALLLWAFTSREKRRVSDLAALAIVPLVASAWWFLLINVDGGNASSPQTTQALQKAWWEQAFPGGLTEHLNFAFGKEAGWSKPWYAYLRQLPRVLGPLGVVLAAAGAVSLCAPGLPSTVPALAGGGCRHSRKQGGFALWPVFVLAPAYLILSALRGKVPWVVIALLPAWAALQGLGMTRLLVWSGRIGDRLSRPSKIGLRPTAPVIATLVVLCTVLGVRGRDYDEVFQRVDAGQWRGSSHSHKVAQLANRLVQDEERVLITSFHYWKNLPPAHPCAVFTYYFSRDAQVLVRSHETGFEGLCDDIREYRLDWAVLSPEPGEAEREILDGFAGRLGLVPYPLPKAVVFNTSGLYAAPSATGVK